MSWEVVYLKEAVKDLEALDHSQQVIVLKAINKTAVNPLPDSEGGYGKPLGNHASSKLSGYLKIKLKKQGLRIVYGLIREKEKMKIIVISVRDDKTVYKKAQDRID